MDNYTKFHRKRHEATTGIMEPGPGAGNRDFVPHTNWCRGNLDPDMLVLKKKTLDRQFFMGPHWRNKPKPQNIDDLSVEEGLAKYARGPPQFPTSPQKHF
jgi:hypothetical protein